MEPNGLGRATVRAKIENLLDVMEAARGRRPPDQIRAVEVEDALVDTGATMLSMPSRLIKQLGLEHRRTRGVRIAGGFGLPVGCGTWVSTMRCSLRFRDATAWLKSVNSLTTALS